MSADRRQAIAALLFGASAIGFAPVLVRYSDTGPAAAAFWRFLFALPWLFVLLRATERTGLARPAPAMLWGGVFLATDFAFWHYGIKLTSVANATVLSNLAPLVVTAVAWLVFRERPRALFLLGMAVAIGGVALMAAAAKSGQGTNPPLGDLFSAVTAVFYAGYFIMVGRARRLASAVQVITWATLAGLPLLLLFAVGLGEQIAPTTALGWAACAALGVVHVAGQGSITWALGRLPASTASVTVLIQPVVAAALGWLVFAEVVTPLQALGAAAALAGVVLAQRASAKPA